MNRICNKCNIEKDISFFPIKDKYKDTVYYKKICKQCLSLENKSKIIRKKIVENNPRYNFNMKDIYNIEKLPLPRYCKYELCKSLLPSNDDRLYCDDWCQEMDKLHNTVNPICLQCGELTGFIVDKNGISKSIPRHLCDKCYKDKYGRSFQIELEDMEYKPV